MRAPTATCSAPKVDRPEHNRRAHCDFYTPKDSSKGQLLEAKANLQRMLASIPLSDDERAAVDEGQSALDKLLDRLVDVPTPSGQTPRELVAPTSATLLPIVDITKDRQDGLDNPDST
ncbi:hypothetical protein [Allosalinactinospora lopnorensis]|uniref:hypothetical protein n=1 Tax=Allosalinactinospora lopnorensis TaxID=1352348 RepID=UPI000623DFE1|nr:hypothetical protein [Allosalinactinospora lopnorensis]